MIHSFWVPELLFKRDVFPGDVRNGSRSTVEPGGRYVGRCAELCGTYHSHDELRAAGGAAGAVKKQFLTNLQDGIVDPGGVGSRSGSHPWAETTFPFETKAIRADPAQGRRYMR